MAPDDESDDEVVMSGRSQAQVRLPTLFLEGFYSQHQAINVDQLEEPMGSKRNTVTTANLPGGATVLGKWKAMFLPTYFKWAGTQLDPWSIPDSTTIRTLQVIWDYIFGKQVPYTISVSDPVHHLVRFPLYLC